MPVQTRWPAVLDKPCGVPTPGASPSAPSRQAAEASCPTAVHPGVPTFFPSACGQRVGARARAGAVPAAAVCAGSPFGQIIQTHLFVSSYTPFHAHSSSCILLCHASYSPSVCEEPGEGGTAVWIGRRYWRTSRDQSTKHSSCVTST